MVTIDTIRKPIEAELAEFDSFVRSHFSAEGGLLSEMLEYVLSSRGKGIRPMIAMLSAAMISPSGTIGKRTYLAAMLVEMIHMASLIHDDVIDDADKRRGRPSVNARWQSKNAVLAGDYVLARNMDIGMSSGQYDIVSHVIRTIATLCEGEVLQGDHASKMDTSREDYFEIIGKKTASLIAVSASAGALSVKGTPAQIAAMHRFGEAAGMAFQIADDILDYTSQSSVTGKPVNADIRERKITLPLIEVLERADAEHRRELLDAVAVCADDPSKAEFVRSAVEREGGIERAREVMKAYLQRAMSVLSQFEPSPYRESLTQFCSYVAEREK
ncbi:MAG: polyprenyl synthetase family protein [Alistipes sp.]|nr:polyprenyl synthetase family protein [Alistipes sp.]